LVLFAALVVAGIVRLLFSKTAGSLRGGVRAELRAESATPTQIEQLPFDLRPKQGNLLELAGERSQQGAYGPAIQYLVAYLLLRLDQARQINLERGKTHGVYLRELRDQRDLAGILKQALSLFERYYFGHHPVAQAEFRSVWQEVDRFHHLLATDTQNAV
jgi:hypothetical protein